MECDKPGEENSGSKVSRNPARTEVDYELMLEGIEYATRFFCRDYANNRLEFSV